MTLENSQEQVAPVKVMHTLGNRRYGGSKRRDTRKGFQEEGPVSREFPLNGDLLEFPLAQWRFRCRTNTLLVPYTTSRKKTFEARC